MDETNVTVNPEETKFNSTKESFFDDKSYKERNSDISVNLDTNSHTNNPSDSEVVTSVKNIDNPTETNNEDKTNTTDDIDIDNDIYNDMTAVVAKINKSADNVLATLNEFNKDIVLSIDKKRQRTCYQTI